MRKIICTYDEYGNETEKWEYSADGKVKYLPDTKNIACVVEQYNVMGDIIYEYFCDENHQITCGPNGFAAKKISYDAVGNILQWEYLDENGHPMTRESGWPAYESQKFNQNGYLTEWCLYDENRNYFPYKENEPRVVYTYDQSGIATTSKQYDCNGQLASVKIKVCIIRDVPKDTPADLAGLQKNDIILQYGSWHLFEYDNYENVDYSKLRSVSHLLADEKKTVVVCRGKNADFSCEKYKFLEHEFQEGMIGILMHEDASDFKAAIEAWKNLSEKLPENTYVVQQLALAQYKSKWPDEEQSLDDALHTLETINPDLSLNLETLGLCGAIYKRKYNQNRNASDLDQAIRYYEKGYVIKNDYYNGENYAFCLLEKSCCNSLPEEEVISLKYMAKSIFRKIVQTLEESIANALEETDEWIYATLSTSCYCIGNLSGYEHYRKLFYKEPKPQWKFQTYEKQIERLKKILSA